MAHPITVEVGGTEPSEVTVGAEFVLNCRVACGQGCDLIGMPVELVGPNEQPAGKFVVGADGSFEAALQAPSRAGQHLWRVVFGPHEASGVRHEEIAVSARINVKPQATSLAVWDIPSPVVTGERFAIKVGAKSSTGITLGGTSVEICDAAGTPLAQGRLGEAPLPGTSALYWTDLELTAPAVGMHAWSARFEPADLSLDHEGAAYRFDVVVVPPAEHRLIVRVIERESAAPIADAQVRLGAYRAATDGSGRAEIPMPKGSYDLTVWKAGYEAPPTHVEVTADLTVEVAVLPLPEENPDAAWTM
jgi:hypothetical protein